MWVATTDEEANFVYDLMIQRNDNTPVLEYAHWLESRSHLKEAEYLRLRLSPEANQSRLATLAAHLDQRWLGTVLGHWFHKGDAVQILEGTFAGMQGCIVEVDGTNNRAGLLLKLFYRPNELTWVNLSHLRLVKRASTFEADRNA